MPRKALRTKVDDITIAGLPIGKLDRMTPETLRVIKNARVILDLTSNTRLLKKFCKNVIDLDPEYWTGEQDETVYTRIANRVLEQAKDGPGVVLVVDGHPGIYQDLTWDIRDRGRRRKLQVTILPAISFLDLMIAFCDLKVDASGLQILECTSVVAYKYPLNPLVDTLLMQIGWFGTSLLVDVEENKPGRFTPLVKYLRKFYPADHIVKLISAPMETGERPLIISTKLADLDKHRRRINTAMTMLVPALSTDVPPADEDFVQQTTDMDHLREIGRASKKRHKEIAQ